MYYCDIGKVDNWSDYDYGDCYADLLKFYKGFEMACQMFLGELDPRYFIITFIAIILTASVGFILYFNKKL